MKKRQFKNLKLNKKMISNLEKNAAHGGNPGSYPDCPTVSNACIVPCNDETLNNNCAVETVNVGNCRSDLCTFGC